MYQSQVYDVEKLLDIWRRTGYSDVRCTLFSLIGLFCQRLPTLQRGLSAIADLLVKSGTDRIKSNEFNIGETHSSAKRNNVVFNLHTL